MWKKSDAYKEQFGGQDDVSIDFSVDPKMHEKLGLRKARKGEENGHDLERMYRFQLDKDEKKIVQIRGAYRKRRELFEQIRENDPYYKEIAHGPELGKDGLFQELIHYTKEESWRSTSQPYGEIAHKRYLEYLANLPKGPTLTEIKDREQRNKDKDLWTEAVILAKDEPTKKELRKRAAEQRRKALKEQKRLKRKEKEKQEKEKGFFNPDDIDDDLDDDDTDAAPPMTKDMLRKLAFINNDFAALRTLPTQREFKKSMKKWHRGIYYPFDMEKGFPIAANRPIVSVSDELVAQGVKSKPVSKSHTRPSSAPMTFTSGNRKNVVLSGLAGQEKQYSDYLAHTNFTQAEAFLASEERKAEREKKKQHALHLQEQHMQRRKGQAGFAFDIGDQAIGAKMELLRGNFEHKQEEDDNLNHDYNQSNGSGQQQQKRLLTANDLDSSSSSSEDEGESIQEDKSEQEDDEYEITQHSNTKQSPKAQEEHHKQRIQRALSSTSFSLFDATTTALFSQLRRAISLPFMSTDGTSSKQDGSSNEKKKVTVFDPNHDHNNHNNDHKINKDNSNHRNSSSISQFLLNDESSLWRTYRHTKRRFRRIFFEETRYRSPSQKRREDGLQRLTETRHELLLPPSFEQQRHANTDLKLKQEMQEEEVKRKKAELPDALLPLREDEMTGKQFRQFVRRKQREFDTEIQQLQKEIRECGPEEDRYKEIHRRISKLQRRREELAHFKADRMKKEHDAARLQRTALEVISEREETLRSIEDTTAEKLMRVAVDQLNRLKRAKTKNKIKQPVPLLPPPCKLNHKNLNATEIDEETKPYDKEVSALLRRRMRERDQVLSINSRFGWLLGKEKSVFDKTYTVDDLILYAQSGDWRGVLDVLDRRKDLIRDPLIQDVSVNARNHDNITAVYAVLLMLIKDETVDLSLAKELVEMQLSAYEKRLARARQGLMNSCLIHGPSQLFGSRKEEMGFDEHDEADRNEVSGERPRFDRTLMILMHYGANLNHAKLDAGIAADGETALHVAAAKGSLQVLSWLLESGVNVNQLTLKQDKTSLMIAAERDQLSTVVLLLRYGAVTALPHQDKSGSTALHYAARHASPLLVQVLLRCGASTSIRSNDNRLPAEEAKMRSRIEIVTLIQSYRSGLVEHLSRLEFLASQLLDEQHHSRYENDNDEFNHLNSMSLSLDSPSLLALNEMGHPHHGPPPSPSPNERRVTKIWRNYLKGSSIQPATRGPVLAAESNDSSDKTSNKKDGSFSPKMDNAADANVKHGTKSHYLHHSHYGQAPQGHAASVSFKKPALADINSDVANSEKKQAEQKMAMPARAPRQTMMQVNFVQGQRPVR